MSGSASASRASEEVIAHPTVSLCVSLCPSVPLSLCPSASLPLCLSASLPLCLSLSLPLYAEHTTW